MEFSLVPGANGSDVLLKGDAFWELIHDLGYAREQVEAVRALAGQSTVSGLDIANALDIEHL